MSEKASLNLTPEQLQSLISTAVATAVAEARKPLPPNEDEQLRINQEKAMRQQTGEQELQIQANRRAEQKRCSHRHPNGQSCVTNVDNLGCVICVHCQGMIKPAEGPYDEPGRYIYDENLYWSLLGARQQTTF
jgi:hypothetical protein